MNCGLCQERNPSDGIVCWACGARLPRRGAGRPLAGMQPEAMRHFSTSWVALETHRAWVDALVVAGTILFGLMLGYFVTNVLPGSKSPASAIGTMRDRLSWFAPAPRMLAVRQLGETQEVRGLSVQVSKPHRSRVEAGQVAGAGAEFMVATVVVDNKGRQPLTYNLADWKVRDFRGRIRVPESINGAGWLSGGKVAPGQQVQGTIAYLVPEGESRLQYLFSPPSLGVMLRWDGTPPTIE